MSGWRSGSQVVRQAKLFTRSGAPGEVFVRFSYFSVRIGLKHVSINVRIVEWARGLEEEIMTVLDVAWLHCAALDVGLSRPGKRGWGPFFGVVSINQPLKGFLILVGRARGGKEKNSGGWGGGGWDGGWDGGRRYRPQSSLFFGGGSTFVLSVVPNRAVFLFCFLVFFF